ncbi:hypothetical protein L5515_018323 [Caenorhabditis briggsae]|uniref:Uncharacterized protein n=1 Tax=Caenorhabditis briggsae TaxID=6238 RepID=A0AAE9FJ18_CAEBR|nr:hypothetical protein L5515_018323 [Caenorhabditis briggsae]
MPTCHEGENVSLARTSTDREGEPREHQERLVREVEKRQDGKTHIAEQKQIREEQERQVKINATHPKKEQRIFKRSNQQGCDHNEIHVLHQELIDSFLVAMNYFRIYEICFHQFRLIGEDTMAQFSNDSDVFVKYNHVLVEKKVQYSPVFLASG